MIWYDCLFLYKTKFLYWLNGYWKLDWDWARLPTNSNRIGLDFWLWFEFSDLFRILRYYRIFWHVFKLMAQLLFWILGVYILEMLYRMKQVAKINLFNCILMFETPSGKLAIFKSSLRLKMKIWSLIKNFGSPKLIF